MRRRWTVGLLLVLGMCACAARFDVDGDRMHANVVRQVEMGPRIPGTPGHAALRGWLEQELTRCGARLEWQRFPDSTLGRTIELHNLIARFGPESGRRIVLCAHYDTRPMSDRDPDPARRMQPVPGANDGGSGVAVLIEMAELMHTRPPRLGVDLVFFDGEDMGRADHAEEFSLGARGYAARLPKPGNDARPAAAFLFDMVGDKDLEIHPEVTAARRAANLVALVLEGARATQARGFRADPLYSLTDDHIPLLDAGLPAVDIIDFDYPAWHTTADQPDQVSPQSLSEVARVAAWLIYRSSLARP